MGSSMKRRPGARHGRVCSRARPWHLDRDTFGMRQILADDFAGPLDIFLFLAHRRDVVQHLLCRFGYVDDGGGSCRVSISVSVDGSFVVVWERNGAIMARRYNASGVAQMAETQLATPPANSDGGTLVRAFAAYGWGWGGNWSSSKDYQHFSYTGH